MAGNLRRIELLLQYPVHFKPAGAGGMPEPAERFLLDLTNPFAREVQPLADLVKGERNFHADAEIEADDLFLAAREGVEGYVDLLMQRNLHGAVVGKLRGFVLKQVETVAVFTHLERGVERQMGVADPHGFPDFFFADVKLARDFLDVGHPAGLLFELALRLADLIEGAHAIEGKLDNTRLLGQRLQNPLAYPPHRVGYELEILLFVKPLGGPDKAEVPLVDKVGKGQALVLIIAGHRNGEPEIRLHQFFERLAVSFMDAAGRLRLLFGGKGLVLADFLEIEGKGIFFQKDLAFLHGVRSCRAGGRHEAIRR